MEHKKLRTFGTTYVNFLYCLAQKGAGSFGPKCVSMNFECAKMLHFSWVSYDTCFEKIDGGLFVLRFYSIKMLIKQ
jgi:hypothetical protein